MKIRIESEGAFTTRVWYDGVEQKELLDVVFVHHRNCFPEISLTHLVRKE